MTDRSAESNGPDGAGVVASPTPDEDAVTLGEADPTIADLSNVYLDGTLVLVGCGAAKRDPEDPVDLHEAAVEPGEYIRGQSGATGPAWEARDLYTSAYFAAKRRFAEVVTRWTGSDVLGWAILSAEHDVLRPWTPVEPYDTTIDDLGGDPTNPNHWHDAPRKRRPDGQENVTEMDWWASMVASGLASWTTSFREPQDGRAIANIGDPNRATTLLVLAGRSYVEPLRERGVFRYGIDRMAGDPNQLHGGLPVETRFLFEEINAGGIGEQMAWLSDAVDRLDDLIDDGGTQATFAEVARDA